MDAKILALIKTDSNRRLMPADIAIADAYAKAIKTDDLVAVGKANSTNTKAYYDGRKKLNEHAEALGAVKAMFDRLPRGGPNRRLHQMVALARIQFRGLRQEPTGLHDQDSQVRDTAAARRRTQEEREERLQDAGARLGEDGTGRRPRLSGETGAADNSK